MKLIALRDIGHAVGTIRAGDEFHAHGEAADAYVRGGAARKIEPLVQVPAVLQAPRLVAKGVAVMSSEALLAPSAMTITDGSEEKIHPYKRGAFTASQRVNSRGWDGLLWDGATVVCIASGPSLTPEQCDKVRDWRAANVVGMRRVIVINTSFRLAPWADVLYACDARWVEAYLADVQQSFQGQLWTQDDRVATRARRILSERGEGLCRKPGVINQGGNSGYQAINLAWMAGATKVVLLGYDMRVRGEHKHWHGDHPAPMNSMLPFEVWLKAYEPLARDMQGSGCDVVNCTPRSALKCFQTAKLEEVLA